MVLLGGVWWVFVYFSLGWALVYVPDDYVSPSVKILCFVRQKNIILVLILLLAVRTVRFTEDSNQQ